MEKRIVDVFEMIREENNLSMTAMAREIDMSQSVYSRKVSGEYSFSLDDLRNLIIKFNPPLELIKKCIGYE